MLEKPPINESSNESLKNKLASLACARTIACGSQENRRCAPHAGIEIKFREAEDFISIERRCVESPALAAREAAKFLNISESFLWELRAKYEIPFVKVGSRTLWLRRDLEEWLKSRRITSPEEETQLSDGRRTANKKGLRSPEAVK